MSSTLIIEQHEMEEGKTTEIDKEIERTIDNLRDQAENGIHLSAIQQD